MPNAAVHVRNIDSESTKEYDGVIAAQPRVGFDFEIYVGHEDYITLNKIKGWIRLVGSNKLIIFDASYKKYLVSVVATSDEFHYLIYGCAYMHMVKQYHDRGCFVACVASILRSLMRCLSEDIP